MASDYPTIPVTTIDPDGVQVSVGAGVDVLCRLEGAGADLAESPLSTNSDGEIVAGTFAATSPGDIVHFRVEEFEGVAASTSIVTT